ncbi:MAG: deaminase [Deltaproteobacteria bacterium]|jgi:deoxycytidylate deaminase|nr:deaminase [Deltaproteobacteria bacterium]
MQLIFTEHYDQLKEKLSSIEGEWDESQPNKKVLRLNGGVMNWYESTFTIQFQGKQEPKSVLEKLVLSALNPERKQSTEELYRKEKPESQKDKQEPITQTNQNVATKYLNDEFEDSEIIIGIVSAVGTETPRVITPLTDRLKHFGYVAEEIKVSSLLRNGDSQSEYERIKSLMEAGDNCRKTSNNNAILSYGAAKLINEKRNESKAKRAFIVNSLKHPDEVEALRKIYGQGFYLLGIHADKKRRLHYLINDKDLTDEQAIELTEIDEDEKVTHGQRTRDTYHLSDFFINFGKNDDQVKNTIQRFLELIFSHPYKNPTFDEFAMFMAFSSSVRSGDLSRQVGAVITKNLQILATGANECPVFGGGLYWAEIDELSGNVVDATDGKDYTRNEDSNKAEQSEIIDEILHKLHRIDAIPSDQFDDITIILNKSRIRDLTEFGRVVHAEMEAIISCGRAGISCIDSTLYCTTFPCHNCAKHIIASGISRVVYVEPYPKSKALEFHSDSIELRTKLEATEQTDNDRVIFEPFTGVGARRFLDFFSMNLGTGNKLKRKDKDGSTIEWKKSEAKIRVALLPESYRQIETDAATIYDTLVSA